MGDINAYYKTVCASELYNIPENEGNKIPKLSSGFVNFEIEGQYRLNKHFSLGLSVGYPIIKSDQTVWYYNFADTVQPVEMRAEAVVHTTVKLNLYYCLSLSSQARFLIGGGGGFYPTKMTYSPGITTAGIAEVTSHFPFGLQAAGQLAIDLSPKVALILDGEYRLAKLSNFKGELSAVPHQAKKGTLWYYKVNYLGSDIWWDEMSIGESAPEYDPFEQRFFKDQRKAIFDLSGFSIRIGFSFQL
ncbi:MAG: outer membrane beta-barrel protein [Candidatus Saccharicenans sp.]|nr:outer membrane beta-barrel protein [Candidatus Saccharicenans sp.]